MNPWQQQQQQQYQGGPRWPQQQQGSPMNLSPRGGAYYPRHAQPSQQMVPQTIIPQTIVSAAPSLPMNVFVGKLVLSVNDVFLEELLKTCGQVLKWKRTMDAETEKPKAFGFCTFANAQSAMRAVRVLNNLELLGQKILVKVGKKELPVIEALEFSIPEREALRAVIQNFIAKNHPQRAPSLQNETKVTDQIKTMQAERDRQLEEERRKQLQVKLSSGQQQKQTSLQLPPAKKIKAEVINIPKEEPATALSTTSKKLGFGLNIANPKSTGASADKKRKKPPELFAPEPVKARPLQKLNDDSSQDQVPEEPVEEAAKLSDKALAESIPTDPHTLFAMPVNWDAVEQKAVVATKLRPWIATKILQYLGEEEPTLIDFLATQIDLRTPPQQIINDLALVLDDDAQLFVIKLWRFLHFHAAR